MAAPRGSTGPMWSRESRSWSFGCAFWVAARMSNWVGNTTPRATDVFLINT